MTQKHEIDVALPGKVLVHLRTLTMIATKASEYGADIYIAAEGPEVNAKDVMDLLTALGSGRREFTIRAEGDDAAEALAGMKTLVETGLFED